jgi:hypothetical protein
MVIIYYYLIYTVKGIQSLKLINQCQSLTTDFVSSNLDQGEVNNTMWWSDLRQVGGFLRILRFPTPIKLTETMYSLVFVISVYSTEICCRNGHSIFDHLLYDFTVRDECMVIWHTLQRSNKILIRLRKRWNNVTTDFVSSNLDQGEVNNTMWWSDLRQVGGFLRILRFPTPIKLTATI